jgi:hypothetical protein
MNNRAIDDLRDLAVKYESNDISTAFELMKIAYTHRPDGPFISQKYSEYKKKLELKNLVNTGVIAMIPIGFRCFTKQAIANKFGIEQASLPFDNGFFPPTSIANVLRNKRVYLGESEHTVCLKYENYISETAGKGIKFELSTYEFINQKVKEEGRNINGFLDNTFGYFTYDKKNELVLAHYNWHDNADLKYSKGIKGSKENLLVASQLLNKRIRRMIELCHAAEHIFFIFGNNQDYNFLQIDNKLHDLTELNVLEEEALNIFGPKFTIIDNVFDQKVNIDTLFEVI